MLIKVLPKIVADQIAAGEVIERPSSIIKELVENSIDAGARSITVTASNSDLSAITVQDDGVGMEPNDLKMSIKRHATSKLLQVEDLDHIASLGFRGEALASIGSVSKMTITSRTRQSVLANKLEVNGGCVSGEIKPSAGNYGTFISVSELFYNTPARKKFLKTFPTEMRHIKMVMLRLAISNPHIAFRLFQDKKLIFGFKSGKIDESKSRFAFLVGKNFAEDSIFLSNEDDCGKLFGWIARPTVSGSPSTHQMRFINGRHVKDRMLDAAMRLGFKDIMFGSKLPPFLIYLTVNPASVDVNVHPSKEEVRFASPEGIKNLIKTTVRKAIATDGFEHQLRSHSFNIGPQVNNTVQQTPSLGNQGQVSPPEKETQILLGPAVPPSEDIDLFRSHGTANFASERIDLGEAIGQIHDIFILSQNSRGIIIVDMHAAHERINYEKLKNEWQKNHKIASQRLLSPITIKTLEERAEQVDDNRSKFELLGFDIIRTGRDYLSIHAYPSLMNEKNLQELLSSFQDHTALVGNLDLIEEGIDKVLANIACKSSLRAYDRISLLEMNALLRQIETTTNSGYCSHGRPTWRFMSVAELDKIFMRGK